MLLSEIESRGRKFHVINDYTFNYSVPKKSDDGRGKKGSELKPECLTGQASEGWVCGRKSKKVLRDCHPCTELLVRSITRAQMSTILHAKRYSSYLCIDMSI